MKKSIVTMSTITIILIVAHVFVAIFSCQQIKAEENWESVEKLEGKGFLSVDGERGSMTNVDFIMNGSSGVLLVEKNCKLYFDQEDGEVCFNDITFFSRKEKTLEKQWSVQGVEGDDVSISGEFIYVVSHGCCGGPDTIKVYEFDGTFLVESFAESYYESRLHSRWHNESVNGKHESRQGLLGLNENIIFYYDTFCSKTRKEGNVLYEGNLPALPESTYYLYSAELVDENTAMIYASTFMACEYKVYFKINDEKKTLDFVKQIPINCDE